MPARTRKTSTPATSTEVAKTTVKTSTPAKPAKASSPQQQTPEPTVVSGKVVSGTPESRKRGILAAFGKSDTAQVGAARLIAEVFYSEDWEDTDYSMADYFAKELGIGEGDHTLSRKAREELASILKDNGTEITVREFATITGSSRGTAHRTLNPAVRERELDELAAKRGDDDGTETGDSAETEKAAPKTSATGLGNVPLTELLTEIKRRMDAGEITPDEVHRLALGM